MKEKGRSFSLLALPVFPLSSLPPLRQADGYQLCGGATAAGGDDDILFAVNAVGHGGAGGRAGQRHFVDNFSGGLVDGTKQELGGAL